MKRFFHTVIALFLLVGMSSCATSLTPLEQEEAEQSAGEKTEAATENNKKPEEPEEPEDPKEDGSMNIILIGNSYSYYWCDELYGMLAAAGDVEAKVYNVYYSGCTFEMHWNWFLDSEANYSFFCNDKNGRREEKNVSLRTCLARQNWDVIGLQQSGRYVYGEKGSEENLRSSVQAHLPKLYGFLKEEFPLAKFFWQQSWAHEIGNGVENLAEQAAVTSWHRNVAKEVCPEYGFVRVPCGEAWEAVRHEAILRENGYTLTSRVRRGEFYDDLTHDGDIGGGQYLNACVWYECLTGKSALENSFRPHYTLQGKDASLSEEKILLLQNAAHNAVANLD